MSQCQPWYYQVFLFPSRKNEILSLLSSNMILGDLIVRPLQSVESGLFTWWQKGLPTMLQLSDQIGNLISALENVDRLKLSRKSPEKVTLRLSLNMIDDANNETSFPHRLLLTNRQAWSFSKAFPNNLSASTKFLKT